MIRRFRRPIAVIKPKEEPAAIQQQAFAPNSIERYRAAAQKREAAAYDARAERRLKKATPK